MSHIRQKIEALITGKEKKNPIFSFEWFMFLLSYPYHYLTLARSFLYQKGFLKQKKLSCPVISVGNITLGGTGKTPMTIYLSELLLELGYRPAVITRGYKGNLEHKGGIVSDGKTILCTPEEAGDEPFMIASTVRVPVIAGKNRYLSGKIAEKKFSCNVLILDDGFQHQQLYRDVDLLLMDEKNPFGNGFTLPRGPLREPACAVQRSHVVIFTRSSPASSFQSDDLTETLNGKPVFRSCHEPFIQFMISKQEILPVKGSVLLFTGVADHSSVEKSCKALGLNIVKHLKYPDHFSYASSDITQIVAEFKNSGAQMVATTHKDFVRLMDRFPSVYPLIVLDVKIKFMGKAGSQFKTWFNKQISKAASNG